MERSLESALVIPVPEAEPVVSKWRMQFDPSAGAGVPAHVTLLYPFKPPQLIDQELLSNLTLFFQRWVSFESQFLRTDRFGSEVLWLAPEPAETFRTMTTALSQKFPEFPLYGGVYDEIVPHLTIAHASHGGDIDAIDRAVSKALPISCKVSEIWLMEQGSDERWRKRAAFALNA